MWLSAVVDDEDYWLWNGWEEHDDCVDEWGLEFFVSADVFVLFQYVDESNVVEGVVVDGEEDDDLPEEGDSKPGVEDCMWCSDVWYFSQWFGVGEEVEVNGGQYS